MSKRVKMHRSDTEMFRENTTNGYESMSIVHPM